MVWNSKIVHVDHQTETIYRFTTATFLLRFSRICDIIIENREPFAAPRDLSV